MMLHEGKLKYTCPMHPEIVKDNPGQCPKCRMSLVPAPMNEANKTDFKSDKSVNEEFANNNQF